MSDVKGKMYYHAKYVCRKSKCKIKKEREKEGRVDSCVVERYELMRSNSLLHKIEKNEFYCTCSPNEIINSNEIEFVEVGFVKITKDGVIYPWNEDAPKSKDDTSENEDGIFTMKCKCGNIIGEKDINSKSPETESTKFGFTVKYKYRCHHCGNEGIYAESFKTTKKGLIE